MIEQLARIVGSARVLTDPQLIAGYARDWTGRWGEPPLAVVRPGSVAEVAEVVRLCGAHRVALVPQGGNTGLVGGGVPLAGEVVLSLRRLVDAGPVDLGARTLEAAAGTTLAVAQRAAIESSAGALELGIDFAARGSATLGGVVATNAGGERVLRHGTTRQQVLGIEAVLADGAVVRRMSGLPKDNTGYDLVQLLVGSEGTLAVITRVLLRLHPAPPARAAALVAVRSLDDATALLAEARRTPGVELDAAEFFTGDGLRLVGEHLGLAVPFASPPPSAVFVLLEAVGGSADEVSTRLAQVLDDRAGLVLDAALAESAADRRRLWALRESHAEAIAAAASAAGTGPPVKLDVAVPPTRLAELAQRLPPILTEAAPGAVPVLFGHLAEGNAHVNLLHAAAADADGAVTGAVLALVAELGGSISAEHGIGLAKRAWLPLTRSAADVAAMRAIKQALDPGGLLTPGRVL